MPPQNTPSPTLQPPTPLDPTEQQPLEPQNTSRGKRVAIILVGIGLLLLAAGAIWLFALSEQVDENLKTESDISAKHNVGGTTQARDIDRKNELQTVRQHLETYFNENGVYPENLQAPGLGIDPDNLTDTMDKAYRYEPGEDRMTYVLTAELEAGEDYILTSVNQ